MRRADYLLFAKVRGVEPVVGFVIVKARLGRFGILGHNAPNQEIADMSGKTPCCIHKANGFICDCKTASVSDSPEFDLLCAIGPDIRNKLSPIKTYLELCDMGGVIKPLMPEAKKLAVKAVDEIIEILANAGI